ncbi:MAG: peptidoglycan DD-metalloendopeptidase family protein [Solirubrobacterales bacterium]
MTVRKSLKLLSALAAGFCLLQVPSASAGDGADWLPLKGESIPVICTFHAHCKNSFHVGGAIDFGVRPGTPVYASGAGKVTEAQGGCGSGSVGCNSYRGNFITISHGSRSSRYLHLSRGVISRGSVKVGQLIGYSGTSGTSTPHLHYDELTNPRFGTGKKNPGALFACHGGKRVSYSNWPRLEDKKLRNTGYGCSAENNDPRGHLDKVGSPAAGKVRVAGWAFDPNAKTRALTIHVYVGGKAGKKGAKGYSIGKADRKRNDVAKAFKGVGPKHGFDKAIAVGGKRGLQAVCVYAINVGKGSNKLLGCRTIAMKSPPGRDTSTPHASGTAHISVAPDGRRIMAAVKKTGTLYTRVGQIGKGWNDFYQQGAANSWATASVAIGSDGKFRLLATKKNGDLYYRIGELGQGWGAFTRLGAAGSWAPTEQPDLVAAANGELAMAAVKKTGTLYTRVGQIGKGWNDFYQQGAANSWATASVAIGSDGKFRLLATKKNGDLYYRIGELGQGWGAFTRLGAAGSWAPTEQPDLVAAPDGKLFMAAVKKTGSLYTRTGQIGKGWDGFEQQGLASSWATYPPGG